MLDESTLYALMFVHPRFLTAGSHQTYGILEAVRLLLIRLENVLAAVRVRDLVRAFRNTFVEQKGIYACL